MDEIQKLPPIIGEKTMTLAEQFTKKGEILGEARGEIKGKVQIISNAIANGHSLEEISKFNGISIDEIKLLLKKWGKEN